MPENVSRGVIVLFAICIFLSFATNRAEGQFYTGFTGGLSTLSGDARSIINPPATAFSSYNPENGVALNPFFGRHLTDYISVQGEYVFNRNGLTLSSARFDGSLAQYQETRQSSEHSVFGSILVYFRKRKSRVRPYLSVGTGFVHLSSVEQMIEAREGSSPLPPHEFSSNMIALRVPVGIDITLHEGWAFRYSFSETLSKNPISDELSPPAPHSLKNFQNLFGMVYRF